MRECCLLVLSSVTSPPQWIRQPQLEHISKRRRRYSNLYTAVDTSAELRGMHDACVIVCVFVCMYVYTQFSNLSTAVDTVINTSVAGLFANNIAFF